MSSRQRIVTGLVFLIVGAVTTLGQAGGKAEDAVLAADAAGEGLSGEDLARRSRSATNKPPC